MLISAALLLTFALGALSGFRIHHGADIEHQTIRTQRLETEVLEHHLPGVRSAYADILQNNPVEAARLRTSYLAYLRHPSTSRAFERAIESEIAGQSRAFRHATTAAREAVAGLIVVAALLVLTLLWLFELERRSGLIDRDNAARAEELMRLRDEFVAVVSHELRTPLTSIIGYLELLVDEDSGDLTSEQHSYLEIVQRSTSRLVELVGDLLLVAETERGPLALELADIDIAALAAHAAESARPSADARGVILRVEPGSGGTVAGDPTRLAQMLDNLISNAIKFTPEGGRVTVHAAVRGRDAVFEVADTGGGVSDADRERLFDPFFRSREASARAVPGTGLGLTITKAIVDAHHGSIEVESAPGLGTTFRVRLPVGERIEAFSR
ncbi:MAG TPA: HAMP domain-containing sensor histidine kinase [Gaiellaceae bacterium]